MIYSYRSDLFDGGSSYYIRRTRDSSVNTDFYLEIIFSDACRSSTLTSQSITIPDLIYNDPYEQEVTAFQDSVDQSYSVGECGEKRISLDPGTPSFLSIELDSVDPVLNNFKIIYDETAATLTDIGEH